MTLRYFSSTARRLSFSVKVSVPPSKVKSSESSAKRLTVSYCARCPVSRLISSSMSACVRGSEAIPAGDENFRPSSASRAPTVAGVGTIKRKLIAALIVPTPATVGARLADEGLKFSSPAGMASDPRTHALIEEEIKRLTGHLAQYETVKRFALLSEDFTFDGGTLTFTLKLKRRAVEEKYRKVIESLYADVAEPRPIFQE